jgi:hypothetical protein
LENLFIFAKTQRSENKHDGHILFNIGHLAHDAAVDAGTDVPLGLDNINIAKLQVQN